MTEKEKMLVGELYDAQHPQLVAERRRARDLLHALNASRDGQRVRRRQPRPRRPRDRAVTGVIRQLRRA